MSSPHPLNMPLPRERYEVTTVEDRAPAEVVASPAMQRELRALAKVIERRAGGRVRELRVERIGETVRISGRCQSFYAKQLAQHAAMDLTHGLTIINEIEVAA